MKPWHWALMAVLSVANAALYTYAGHYILGNVWGEQAARVGAGLGLLTSVSQSARVWREALAVNRRARRIR